MENRLWELHRSRQWSTGGGSAANKCRRRGRQHVLAPPVSHDCLLLCANKVIFKLLFCMGVIGRGSIKGRPRAKVWKVDNVGGDHLNIGLNSFIEVWNHGEAIVLFFVFFVLLSAMQFNEPRTLSYVSRLARGVQ